MRKLILGSLAAASLFAGSVAFAQGQPTLTVSGGNTPYATVHVAGAGFTPGETVHVMLGLNATDTVADSNGAFSDLSLTIPNLSSGMYIVLGVGQTSGAVAFSYLWVNSLYPQASPSSWYIAPGATLTWSGTDFVPNEQITVTGPGGSTVASFTAGSDGTFSGLGSSTVPLSARSSTITYTLSGAQSGAHASFPITVANLYPYVNPSIWYATPGTSVTFSGAGFGPGEGVSLYLGTSTTVLAHATADAAGAFSDMGPVTLPFKTPSPVAYRIVGDESGAATGAPITLAAFYPSLSPSAYYAAPGSHISLNGSGFAPNEVVDVAIGSTTATTTADATGAFTLPSVKVPPVPNSTITIAATGQESGATTSFVMAIGAYYSWETLSTYWAQGGSPLSVFGHNFVGGESVVISSGGTTLGTTTAADDGSFTASVSVPFAMPGPATILATGAESGATAQAQMTVAPVYTDLQMKQYYGTPGSPVEFIGHGYLPDEPITVTTDRTGSTVVASFTTDGTGSFDDSSYHIPADFTEGNLTFTVSSGHSYDSKSIVYYVTGS